MRAPEIRSERNVVELVSYWPVRWFRCGFRSLFYVFKITKNWAFDTHVPSCFGHGLENHSVVSVFIFALPIFK